MKRGVCFLSKQIHDAGRRLLASSKIFDAYKPFATTYYTYLKIQRELKSWRNWRK